MKKHLNRQNLSLLATFVIALLLFAGASWRYVGFASPGVMINLFDDNSFLGIAAVGMTFVILSGGIDLSVGAVVGLTSILTALLIQKYQISPFVILPLMLLGGALFGAMMGLFIALFDLAPFLVTLAGMFFARGLAYTLSLDSIPVNHPLFVTVSQMRLNLGFGAVPAMAFLFLVVVAIGIYVSTQTQFGRAIYAVGGNVISARLMGLRTERYLIGVYALSGFFASLAGIAYTFYTSSGNATAAMGLELDAIAAVVVGGTLLSGGRGTVIGTLVGTLILGMIQTIITFESTLSSWWTKIVIGALLFFFVVLQKGVSRLSHRSMQKTVAPAVKALFIIVGILAVTQPSSATLKKTSSPRVCPPGQYVGRRLAPGLFQMTGTHLNVGQTLHAVKELPDPSPPFINEDGSVELYGSTKSFIRYKDWDEFERGGCFEIVPLNIVGHTGQPYGEVYDFPWDVRKFRIEDGFRPAFNVLLGGAMSPTKGRPIPIWPDDNINRRVYFFRLGDLGAWVRDRFAVVRDVFSGWRGHSYGGNLIQVDSPQTNLIQTHAPGEMAFFYEKVSDDKHNGPYKTELFAVRMKDFDKPVPNSEVKIFDLGPKPYPSTRRIGQQGNARNADHGYLVEGPRPVQVQLKNHRVIIVGFSSGDFPTDSYHLNFMWSRNLMGPYEPILTDDQKDLKDFGREIKNRYGLSWVGRPSLYQTPKGTYQILFHGVVKNVLPDNNYTYWPSKYQLWEFYRCIFKVNVEITEGRRGQPIIRLLADKT